MPTRKLPHNPILTSYDNLIANLGDVAMVPMPYSVWEFARKILERGKWPTSFIVGEATNKLYEIPETDTENWLKWQDELATFLNDSEDFMTKFDDFIASQSAIEDAIRDLQSFMRESTAYGAVGGGVVSGGAIDSGYPIDKQLYLDDSLTTDNLFEGQCKLANWLWDSFVAACNEVDDIVDNLSGTDLGTIIIGIAESAEAVISLLPDDLADMLHRFPALTLTNILDNLDDEKDATLEALRSAYSQKTILDAFAWIDNTISSSGITVAKMILNSLSVIGLDSSRWFNLPDYETCEVDTGLGDFWQSGDTGIVIDPIYSSDLSITFDSVTFDVWKPGESDNGHEYLNLHNETIDSKSRLFIVSGITEPFQVSFFAGDDGYTDFLQSVTENGSYLITGCNSVRARTVQYSGDTLRVTISASEE